MPEKVDLLNPASLLAIIEALPPLPFVSPPFWGWWQKAPKMLKELVSSPPPALGFPPLPLLPEAGEAASSVGEEEVMKYLF